ncbi:MAG: hypothetical protein GDA54_06320 [Alphaproteobacteria bacterium GM7ARS4]|nr:hypothetical protein [Alphaproteobacteria bacterium GM7ARS4]
MRHTLFHHDGMRLGIRVALRVFVRALRTGLVLSAILWPVSSYAHLTALPHSHETRSSALIDAHVQAYKDACAIAYDKQAYRDAIMACSAVIDSQTEDSYLLALAYTYRGISYAYEGRMEEALADYARAKPLHAHMQDARQTGNTPVLHDGDAPLSNNGVSSAEDESSALETALSLLGSLIYGVFYAVYKAVSFLFTIVLVAL